MQWELLALSGTGEAAADRRVLLKHSGSCELKTTVEKVPLLLFLLFLVTSLSFSLSHPSLKPPPIPERVIRPALDVNVTWLLHHVRDAEAGAHSAVRSSSPPPPPRSPSLLLISFSQVGLKASFAINRGDTKCKTPRRNADVEGARAWFDSWCGPPLPLLSLSSPPSPSRHAWCGKVHSYFTSVQPFQQAQTGVSLSAVPEGAVFLPVLPVLDPEGRKQAHELGVAPWDLLAPFLGEQKRTLAERAAEVKKTLPGEEKVISHVEGKVLTPSPSPPLVLTCEVCLMMLHARTLVEAYADATGYVEYLLAQQLVRAIGKELSLIHI